MLLAGRPLLLGPLTGISPCTSLDSTSPLLIDLACASEGQLDDAKTVVLTRFVCASHCLDVLDRAKFTSNSFSSPEGCGNSLFD